MERENQKRDFCGWEWSLEEKIEASPVDRDSGLADLKIQLPGSMRACLFGVGEERGQVPGPWRSTWLFCQCTVDPGQVMLYSWASASSPQKQGAGPSECSIL